MVIKIRIRAIPLPDGVTLEIDPATGYLKIKDTGVATEKVKNKAITLPKLGDDVKAKKRQLSYYWGG